MTDSFGVALFQTMNQLDSCGGCQSIGEGRDCNKIENALGVGCTGGFCVACESSVCDRDGVVRSDADSGNPDRNLQCLASLGSFLSATLASPSCSRQSHRTLFVRISIDSPGDPCVAPSLCFVFSFTLPVPAVRVHSPGLWEGLCILVSPVHVFSGRLSLSVTFSVVTFLVVHVVLLWFCSASAFATRVTLTDLPYVIFAGQGEQRQIIARSSRSL